MRTVFASLTVAALLGGVVLADDKKADVKVPAGFTAGATVEGLTEYKLKNGLRVLLLPDPSQPKVTVNCTVFVGSRHEGYGETGMAHLLEHMVFKGCPKFPD
ncbi:MAG: insulinase family protein, partial [Gemmataceae bacterium]|nr:insulinase family protein [Gemmataceae bacterium]